MKKIKMTKDMMLAIAPELQSWALKNQRVLCKKSIHQQNKIISKKVIELAIKEAFKND